MKRACALLPLLFFFTGISNLVAQSIVVCDDVRDPLTLDPYKEFSEKNHTIIQQIFEGLVRFDTNGKIEEALAVKWERPIDPATGAPDPLRMRFQLRQGVSFHNGEPFDAEAVRFSILRYLDPKIGFPAAAFISTVADVEVRDKYTVDIVTKFPDGLLLNRLTLFLLIVPPHYVQENGEDILNSKPVGTGAFMFSRWDKGDRILLTANTNYWMKGFPRVGGLEFKFVPTTDKQLELLRSGEVDIVTEVPGTRAKELWQQKETDIIKKEVFWTVGATMNMDHGKPLSDIRVRKALNHAIHRKDLVHYDCFGNGKALASLTMEKEEGHEPHLDPYKFDPELARALLTEAKVLPLKLKTLVRVQGERTARLLASQLARVGVTLEFDDKSVFSDSDVIQKLKSENWDLAIAGMPDPMCHTFFIQSILLYSKSPFSLQKDDDFDRRLEKMAQTLDEVKRTELAKALDRYVYDNALSLFTYQSIKTYGIRRRLHFDPYISGMPYFFSTYYEETDANRR